MSSFHEWFKQECQFLCSGLANQYINKFMLIFLRFLVNTLYEVIMGPFQCL